PLCMIRLILGLSDRNLRAERSRKPLFFKKRSKELLAYSHLHMGRALNSSRNRSTSFARLQCRQGRRDEPREALAETYARFSGGFDTADLKAAGYRRLSVVPYPIPPRLFRPARGLHRGCNDELRRNRQI